MDYYNIKTKQIETEARLKLVGINTLNLDVLDILGFYPVEYNYIEYDEDFYTLEGDIENLIIDENEKKVIVNFQKHFKELNIIKDRLKTKTTEMRWEIETGGILDEKFVEILTTVEDQNRITSLVQGINQTEIVEINFKTTDDLNEFFPGFLPGVVEYILNIKGKNKC